MRNARSTPIVVTLRQDGLWRENEVLSESIKGRRTDSDSFAWDVPVAANGEATLKVTAPPELVTHARASLTRARAAGSRRRRRRAGDAARSKPASR